MPEDDDIQFIGVPVRHVKREPKESHDGSGISTVYRHHPLVAAPQVEMDNRPFARLPFTPTFSRPRPNATKPASPRSPGATTCDTSTRRRRNLT
jgi:hypothetical protein